MKLTKRVVDGLEPRERRYVVWDDELPRFGVRVETSGVRSFVVDYSTQAGRRRRLTLGRYGAVTCDEARTLARRALNAVAEGSDPVQAKREAREAVAFGEFAERYLRDHADTKKKARSAAEDRRLLERDILPRWRSRRVRDITRADVARLHSVLKDTPTLANRVVALLSKMFALAEAWGEREPGTNPARGIERYPETRRARFLSGEELALLGTKLDYLEPTHPSCVRAVRLLLLTGCRLNEVLSLRWEDVDIERSLLHLRDAKAGPRDVPLGAAAVTLLKAAPRKNEWVTPGRLKGKHLVNLQKWWSENIRDAIEEDDVVKFPALPGVRIHDLRHTVGATGAGAGLSMLMIAHVLGHRQVSTTERYSHLAPSPLHEAADRIASEIDAALSGREPAAVVEMKK